MTTSVIVASRLPQTLILFRICLLNVKTHDILPLQKKRKVHINNIIKWKKLVKHCCISLCITDTSIHCNNLYYTHFSPSSASGVLADAEISSPGSWPFPLGMALASAGVFSTVSAGLSSLISATVANNLSLEIM